MGGAGAYLRRAAAGRARWVLRLALPPVSPSPLPSAPSEHQVAGATMDRTTGQVWRRHKYPIFYNLTFFLRKFKFCPRETETYLCTLEVGVKTHDAKVTRLDATDLDSKMPDRVQQDILGGVDVADTSVPQYRPRRHVFWRRAWINRM